MNTTSEVQHLSVLFITKCVKDPQSRLLLNFDNRVRIVTTNGLNPLRLGPTLEPLRTFPFLRVTFSLPRQLLRKLHNVQ